MVAYLVRRALYGVVMLILISVVGFAVIQAPPGNYLTTYIARLERQGDHSARMRINELKARYGLDRAFPAVLDLDQPFRARGLWPLVRVRAASR